MGVVTSLVVRARPFCRDKECSQDCAPRAWRSRTAWTVGEALQSQIHRSRENMSKTARGEVPGVGRQHWAPGEAVRPLWSSLSFCFSPRVGTGASRGRRKGSAAELHTSPEYWYSNCYCVTVLICDTTNYLEKTF